LAPPITVLGIVTHDRVTSLTACLESYRANCRRYARLPEFVVMDDVPDNDARGGEARARVRAALQAFQQTGDETVRYAGPSEKRRFADVLARESSVSRELIDFALFGDRRCKLFTGANRNGLLLDTVGALVFGADDDTLARTAAAPEGEPAVSFSSEYEPREFWFFPDRRAALDAAPPTESELLASHERFLGRTLAEVGGPAGVAGHIAITLPGLVGDSGMGSPHYLLTLNGASRERFLASRTAYESALRSREVLRTVRQPTVSASAFGMTTFYGFDHRQMLPPFFPVARNSDGIFGLMVQRSIEGSHVAFLPSVLLHAPAEPRAFAGDEAWAEPARVRMADVLIASILVHEPGPRTAGHGPRLHRLGWYLQELASLKTADFEAFVRSAQQVRNLTFNALLETRLREHGGSPTFWADDARKAIAVLQRTATAHDYIVPWDLGNAGDVDSARRLAQELVRKFGELVEVWPTLVEAAARLRAKGCRVSEQV
jgi:hypothetical protein